MPVFVIHSFIHSLDEILTQIKGEVQLHVRTCTHIIHISQTAGRTVFKFGVCLGTH